MQVQHPLRYFSAGEILDRYFDGLYLMPRIDEFFPDQESGRGPTLQQSSHFFFYVGLVPYRKQLNSFPGYEMCFKAGYQHVMFSPLGKMRRGRARSKLLNVTNTCTKQPFIAQRLYSKLNLSLEQIHCFCFNR